MTTQRSTLSLRPSLGSISRWLSAEKVGEFPSGGRYLLRWAFLGVLIGVVAGLGAISFYWLLEHATDLFLGRLAGFHPASPVGEGNRTASSIAHPWLLPLVVALGGLLSGLLVFLLAPEAEGHGTDAAIDAFHNKAGLVRARIVPIKALASAIMIGAGGSGGREGPAAQISAGIGSLLGRALKLDARERRLLLAAGIGAGIGAIFRAPFGGAVLAAEILYTDDMEIEAIFPALIASIVGYSIYGSWAGWTPIFGEQAALAFNNPLQLLHYAGLGLACGAVGLAYVHGFYGIAALSNRVPLPAWLKPALGGLLVGLLGLVLPGALGTGYGSLQEVMTTRVLQQPLWVLLALPFAKILATSLSIGTGGSGGIFGPGMVIGGTLGAALWRLGFGVLPGLPASPAPFAIVGMMALFGSISHARLAVMLMVAEMTGNLSLLAPAMIAIGMASLVVGETSIYRSQLRNRSVSPAHALEASFPLLHLLKVAEAMARPLLKLSPSASVEEAAAKLAGAGLSGAPVVDAAGRLLGVLTTAEIARVEAPRRSSESVESTMNRQPLVLEPIGALDEALEAMATAQVGWAPVVHGLTQELTGVLGMSDIVSAYRKGQLQSARELRDLAGAVRRPEPDLPRPVEVKA